MRDISSVFPIVFTFQMCISHVELYKLTCPSGAHWKMRAIAKCNSTLQYFCLYNNVKQIYVEGCNGPDWDRKGSKRIFSGFFTRGNCSQERYQPFNFKTNGRMSDCIFKKSICNEEGQTIHQADSTKTDRTCRCNHLKNYSFTKTPKNVCYCIPAEEDCSCYIRQCPANYTLSKDHGCIRSGNQKNIKCLDKNIQYKTVGEKPSVKLKQFFLFHTRFKIRGISKTGATVVFCLCLILLIGAFFSVLSFNKSVSVKLQTFEVFFQRRKTGTLPRDEVNFLRMIYLLFRVACPVIRLTFNHEIQPKQLRKTLDDNKFKMETLYRKSEEIINDYQWGLLYNPVKGETVKSEEFDIRLTIYLLCTFATIKIDSAYPEPSDISDSAMLSRIKYIRNSASRRFAADLSKDRFNQYWNDIRQAIHTLVFKLDIEIDQENIRLIENLKEKSLLIPEGSHLHQKDHTFTYITTEENNFLIGFYVLENIVYPAIQKEFNTKCTDWTSEENNSPNKEESENLDLKWMIFKLKKKAVDKGQQDYSDQLDVIYEIQREIVQSSTGMLNEERLNKILECTKKAVLYLGEKWSEEKILRLQHLENILNQ